MFTASSTSARARLAKRSSPPPVASRDVNMKRHAQAHTSAKKEGQKEREGIKIDIKRKKKSKKERKKEPQ